MARFLLLFLVFYTPWVKAGCPSQIDNDHLVITIEGLAGIALGSHAYQLARDVNESHYGIANYSYANANGIVTCVRRLAQQHPNLRIDMIGHSWGGHATTRVANQLAQAGFSIDNLLTFDSRLGEGRCGSNGGPSYAKPSNVSNLYNFYQCGALPGVRYTGNGVHNTEVTGVAHVDMPQSTQGMARARQVLNSGSRSSASVHIARASAPRTPRVSPFRPSRAEVRAGNGDFWDRHANANRPAICFNQVGVRYECTYAEASRNSYGSRP